MCAHREPQTVCIVHGSVCVRRTVYAIHICNILATETDCDDLCVIFNSIYKQFIINWHGDYHFRERCATRATSANDGRGKGTPGTAVQLIAMDSDRAYMFDCCRVFSNEFFLLVDVSLNRDPTVRKSNRINVCNESHLVHFPCKY